MRKKLMWMGLAVMVIFLSVAFLAGCAKKATLKEEAVATREQKSIPQAPAKAATNDQTARERVLRDQASRDQTLRDQAAKAAREAAEKAKRDAAILKELQIPDVNFDFDKYNLKPEAQAILKAGAPAYLKYREYKLVLEGHCDERGTAEYNLALGEKRATEAAKYLADLGIEKERIKTISYGKEMPLEKGHDEAAWAKNRRAHFVIFPPTKN